MTDYDVKREPMRRKDRLSPKPRKIQARKQAAKALLSRLKGSRE